MDFGISDIFFSCCLFRVWTWLCLYVPLHAEPPAAAFKAPTEVEPGTETQQWEQHHQHCQQVESWGGLERAARGREHTLKQKYQACWPHQVWSYTEQPNGFLYHHPWGLGPLKIINSRNHNLTVCGREGIESGKTTKEIPDGIVKWGDLWQRDSQLRDLAACVHACNYMLKVILGQL